MLKEINYNDHSKEMLEALKAGAFLTVKQGPRINTMTIGWGSIGYVWNMPVFMVMVRYSRYTYELIDKASDFTVSVPLHGQLKGELAFCGSKSGRDVDKIAESGLILKDSKEVASPLIDGCDLYFECKIMYKQGMDRDKLNDFVKSKCYSDDDYHVMYFGKIVKSYLKQD